MRETKFRGMDIEGNWHYGNLAVLTENARHLKQGHYISNSIGLPFAYQVRPETVGQYIGLKDKNGKEIYEGDILHDDFGGNYRGEVYWSEDWAMFTVKGEKVEAIIRWASVTDVIGNIYAYPELLEGGQA